MTYIITPYQKAFELPRGQVEFHLLPAIINEETIGYSVFVTHHQKIFTYPISPIFTTMEQDLTNCHIECENLDDCQFYAIEWLTDFLRRLSKNPHVIHCTSDAEIFVD